MKKKLLAWGMALGCTSLSAQSYTLKGAAAQPDGKKLDFGNAVLLQVKDSSFYKGAVIDSGRFVIAGVNADSILLRLTSVGFEPFFQLVTNPSRGEQVDLGTITLKPVQVKEVEITATVPLIQNEGDRRKINVEGTMLNSAGTAMDVLESSPGLLVGTDGNVTVFGKGSALVLLDGQRVPVDLLRALPSDQVRYVEVLEHPPASYDAQGRVVVNIVTKKNALEGYQLNFFHNASYGTRVENIYGYNGASLLWKKKKLTLIGRYGVFAGERWSKTEYLRDFISNTDTVSMYNSLDERKRFRGNHYFGTGLKYDFDTARSLNVFYNGSYNRSQVSTDDTNQVHINNTSFVIEALTKKKTRGFNHNASIDFTHRLDTLGGKRSAVISFSQYSNRMTGDISEYVTDSASGGSIPKRSFGDNAMIILTAQGDLARAFGKTWLWENGVKFTAVSNGSNSGLERQFADVWVSDSTIYNAYNYNELTPAVYSQLKWRKKKWDVRGGLRTELTRVNGYSERLGRRVVDTTYLSFFPSFFADYELMKDLKLTGSYAFRIERPSFNDLDPFITYIDSLSSLRGNPALRPEYIQEASVGIIYLEAASLEFGYAHIRNSINTYVERVEGTNEFTGQERNFDFERSYTADLELPYENKWWTTSNGVGYAFNYASYRGAGDPVINSRGFWYYYTYQAFRFLKHWTAEGFFQYNTAVAEGLFIARPMYSMQASLLFKTKEGKLSVRLSANDLLRSERTIGDSQIPGFDLTYKEYYDSNYYRLQINWRIGKLKQTAFNEKNINSEERGRVK